MSDEQIIDLGPEEDLLTVRKRLEETTAGRITLIIPPQTQLRSHVGWRLLHSRMRELGKDVLVKSSDNSIRAIARAAGFTVADVENSPHPVKGRPVSMSPPKSYLRPPLRQRQQLDQPPAPEYHVTLPVEQGNTTKQNSSAYIRLAREIVLFGLQLSLTSETGMFPSPKGPVIVRGIQTFCQIVQMSEETVAEKMQLLQFAENQAAQLSWQETSTALVSIGKVYALLDWQKAMVIADEVSGEENRLRLYRALASAAFATGDFTRGAQLLSEISKGVGDYATNVLIAVCDIQDQPLASDLAYLTLPAEQRATLLDAIDTIGEDPSNFASDLEKGLTYTDLAHILLRAGNDSRARTTAEKAATLLISSGAQSMNQLEKFTRCARLCAELGLMDQADSIREYLARTFSGNAMEEVHAIIMSKITGFAKMGEFSEAEKLIQKFIDWRMPLPPQIIYGSVMLSAYKGDTKAVASQFDDLEKRNTHPQRQSLLISPKLPLLFIPLAEDVVEVYIKKGMSQEADRLSSKYLLAFRGEEKPLQRAQLYIDTGDTQTAIAMLQQDEVATVKSMTYAFCYAETLLKLAKHLL